MRSDRNLKPTDGHSAVGLRSDHRTHVPKVNRLSVAAASVAHFYCSVLTHFILTFSCDICFSSVSDGSQNVAKYYRLICDFKKNSLCHLLMNGPALSA